MDERGVELDVDTVEEPTTDDEVFYNTEMVPNRDISVACLAVYAQGEDDLTVCDALAASGVRGLRYLQEVDGIGEMLINDIKEAAVDNIRTNLERNGLSGEAETSQEDANLLLTRRWRSLDAIDIDPFGSPMPYVDSAARAITHGGAVGVTATDLGPLHGSYPEVCRRRYAADPLDVAFGHEIGLRILIKEVVQTFARYDRAFSPDMAWHERHYHRVFGTVHESKQGANRLLGEVGTLSFCPDCRWRAFDDVRDCPGCGAATDRAGPLWTGKLAREEFLWDVVTDLDSRGYEEAHELVETVGREAPVRVPFYDTHEMASVAGTSAPRMDDLLDRLRTDGYRAARTHFSPQGLRTDAPHETVIAAFRDDI